MFASAYCMHIIKAVIKHCVVYIGAVTEFIHKSDDITSSKRDSDKPCSLKTNHFEQWLLKESSHQSTKILVTRHNALCWTGQKKNIANKLEKKPRIWLQH